MIEQSKEITVGGVNYTIHKFKPTEGRRIIAGYPISIAPKIGDYEHNEELMFRLMSHVEVHLANGEKLALGTQALIDNHVPSWEDLVEVEWLVLQFNCPFIQNGGVNTFIETAKGWAMTAMAEIMEKAFTDTFAEKSE